MMFFDLFLLVIFVPGSTMVNHQEIHHLEAYFYVFPSIKTANLSLLNAIIIQSRSYPSTLQFLLTISHSQKIPCPPTLRVHEMVAGAIATD